MRRENALIYSFLSTVLSTVYALESHPALLVSSLYKRANGVYYVAYYDLSRRPSRKHVSTRLRKKREAEQIQAALDAGFTTGAFCPWRMDARRFLRGTTADVADGLDLSAFGLAAEAFLSSRSNLRPTTRERYESIVRRFAGFVGHDSPTRDVTTSHVQAWIDSTPTKPVTANNYRKALSTLFRWLESEGVRAGDPATGVRLPRVPDKHAVYLSKKDVDRICLVIHAQQEKPHVEAGTGLWLVPIVRANVYLGLRVSELIHLQWQDVDLERATLVVRQSDGFSTKSGKDRTLPLARPVLDVLGSLNRRSHFVFPNHTGTQLNRHYVSSRFKHFCRLAGLPEHVHFHTTRHTAASWLAEKGVSVEAIRLYLGHSSIQVTQRYMHLAPDAFASQITSAFTRPCSTGDEL